MEGRDLLTAKFGQTSHSEKGLRLTAIKTTKSDKNEHLILVSYDV
jgi:hypothetical protein